MSAIRDFVAGVGVLVDCGIAIAEEIRAWGAQRMARTTLAERQIAADRALEAVLDGTVEGMRAGDLVVYRKGAGVDLATLLSAVEIEPEEGDEEPEEDAPEEGVVSRRPSR